MLRKNTKNSLNFIFCLVPHPCDEATKGGCAQICTKDGDNAVCSCSSGTLNADGKTCDGAGVTAQTRKKIFFQHSSQSESAVRYTM